jgi:cell division protease FtsH
VLTEDEERRIAYHEAAHAVVAAALGRGDDIHRVTILARTKGLVSIGALGLARGDQDQLYYTRNQLFSQIVISMAGLAAEEMVIGDMSTGAEEDIENATNVARDIIGRYGMSPSLGRTRLLAADVDKFLGSSSSFAQISPETHEQFDQEVRRLVEAGEEEAIRIIKANMESVTEMAERLNEAETLEGRALIELIRKVPVDDSGLAKPFSAVEGNGLGYVPAGGKPSRSS